MTAALVIACMLTEGESTESPSPRTLSGPVYTWSRFLWLDSYPIMKRPVLRIRYTFETNLNLIAQTTYVWDAFQTKLDKCKCICLLKSHMYILLLQKVKKNKRVVGYMTCNSQI